jgi:shikimate kinase/3-dehydroquinate synthase
VAALFLIGFMASGKTTIGRRLAAMTNRPFVDLDDVIAQTIGEPVAELVKRDEPAFRRRETEALREVIGRGDVVLATGGGCGANSANVELMRAAGTVIALGVDVAEARERAKGGPERPLLANAEQLVKSRASSYRLAHAVVPTNRQIDDVVTQVFAVERLAQDYKDATIVSLENRSYPIVVGDRLGDPLRQSWGTASKIAVITDRNVAAHWTLPTNAENRERVELVIEPGEASKSYESYARLCNELVERGLDRGSILVAFGGGVVGDLTGFVAATLFRGIAFVQVPTTIVAMTDAAIGGKTAIDIPAGKNLVGAFHQPWIVDCALETLQTLPARERQAGFGELWKYALLDGPELWRLVASCTEWAREGGDLPAAFREVMRRSIAYKAEVVGRDEHERLGVRALLNLGHTVGHAIESASGMLHGEAVALGLVAAARVSTALLGTRADLERELIEGLHASGLSVDIDRWLTDEVLARMAVDKKRVGKTLKYIAIRDVGDCEPVEIEVTELRRILRSNSTT